MSKNLTCCTRCIALRKLVKFKETGYKIQKYLKKMSHEVTLEYIEGLKSNLKLINMTLHFNTLYFTIFN